MIARSRFGADPTFGKRRSRGGRTANRCLRGTSETAAFSFRYGESFVKNGSSPRRHWPTSLFQGDSAVVPAITNSRYLLELCRYIVLNPVRAGMVTHPEDYRWSSFTSTAAPGKSLQFLFTDWILAQFDQNRPVAQIRYREFVRRERQPNHPGKGLSASVFSARSHF